jgi:hypothetical protein
VPVAFFYHTLKVENNNIRNKFFLLKKVYKRKEDVGLQFVGASGRGPRRGER